MTDIEVRESEALTVPGTGQVVNLKEPRECAIALQDIRDMEGRWREVKRILSDAIVRHWGVVGSAKTFAVGGGRKVEIRGGPEKTYDAEAIREELLAAGMPENRVSQIVVETVSYKVAAVEATRAAKANPEYARIIERHTTEIEKPYEVAVRRR
jgi:hypothetical protein